ncbi:hypothetical protein Taro_033537 [Colocasia esculenta]|uniref:Retrotransposon gag domain-containing protein n=1 Tax=Colocasia esculenta TaxID=4460 RepID=A0A843VY67_COLES|nr:hypothetical protein [Colocasia esculenta]
MSFAGRVTDVDLGKATASTVAFRSRRMRVPRSQLSCIFKQVWLNRAFERSARTGEVLCGGSGRFRVLRVFSTCSRHEGIAWSGGNAMWVLLFAFFMEGFVGVIRRGVPGLGFLPVKAMDPPVAFRTRQADPSRSAYERDISGCRIPMATWGPVAFTAEGLFTAPTVNTSLVGSPRFYVSQARVCSGLVPVLGTVEVCIVFLDTLALVVMRNQWSPMGPGKSDEHPLYEELTGSFPTEPVTREAHPYPLSVQIRQAKREQFWTLRQGNLSVLEYEMKFMALSRYAPYVVIDNTMMVEYFIRGLRAEL